MSNREAYYSKDHCWDDHDDFDSIETDKNINIAKVIKSGNSCVKVKVDAEFEVEFEEDDDDDDEEGVGGVEKGREIRRRREKRKRKCK